MIIDLKENLNNALSASQATHRSNMNIVTVGYVHLVCISSTAFKCPLYKHVFITLLL